KWMKTQITVADITARQVRCLSQSLNRAIFFASPRVNHGEISDQRCSLDGIFANRRQFDRTFAFANRILVVAKYGVNHTEGTNRGRIVRLLMYFFGEPVSCALKRRASCRLIATHPSSKALAPAAREWNCFVEASTVTHICQRTADPNRIVFAQHNEQPRINEPKRGIRVVRQNCINHCFERFNVGATLEIDQRASYSAGNILRSDCKHAIESRSHLFVAAQRLLCKRGLLEHGKILWIQLQCLRDFLERLLPATLAPVNVTSQECNPRLVRQSQAGKDQLLPCAVVIPVRPIIMLSQSQMGFSRFWA